MGESLDTFFDTYFFKTIHNTDGRLTDANGQSYATNIPYQGICGVGIAWQSRYGRRSNANLVQGMMHYGSPRYAIYGGDAVQTLITNVDVESGGWGDAAHSVPFGTGAYLNPYVAGKLDGYIRLMNGSTGKIINLNGGGSDTAATNIGGGSAMVAINVGGAPSDVPVASSYQHENLTLNAFQQGSASYGLSRDTAMQYSFKYYDNLGDLCSTQRSPV